VAPKEGVSHVRKTTVIIAFLLGLVSIGSAIRIWSDPNCQSLVFFEAESTIRRTIPVSCVASGAGADAWALLFFVLGAIPIGYAVFLLLDEFGPTYSNSTKAQSRSSGTESLRASPTGSSAEPPQRIVDLVDSASLIETWKEVDDLELPKSSPLVGIEGWLRERVDNPIGIADDWLYVFHNFPAWSHIHDVSVQYLDGWSITAEELVMVRLVLDDAGEATLSSDNIPEPRFLQFPLVGRENVEGLARVTILAVTAQFLLDQLYPLGASSSPVAGNKHHKTIRLARTVANIVREVQLDKETWGGPGSGAVFIYETLVLEKIPPSDVVFFSENY